jgi:hypothetical protein
MGKGKKETRIISPYYRRMHRLGKIMTVLAILVFLAVPTAVCIKFGIMPSIKQVLATAAGLIVIFVPMAISEILSETPIMGSSYYISAITGNVMNLKLPAAFNAIKVADVEPGTEESDAIVGVAVAISSVTTMIIIAIGVILMQPLEPFLTSGGVQLAAKYVLPALFGSLALGVFGNNIGGGIIIRHRLLAAILPLIVLIVLYLVNAYLYTSFEGFMILITIPILYFISKKLYKAGKITVTLPGDEKAVSGAECASCASDNEQAVK